MCILPSLEVKINFLVPGHTHEDIDQLFSCIAGDIARNKIRILIDIFGIK